MKFSISKKALLDGLSKVSSVPERRGLVPALSSVLLTATTERLTIAATDLIVSVSVNVEVAETKVPGQAAVPCKDFVERVRALPEGPVSISLDAKTQRLTIAATGTPRKFVLPTHPAEEFPATPQAHWKEVSVIPSGKLRRLIASVDHAMSGDITRPHLAGILVEWADDTIRAVATDGHRLSLQEIAGTPTVGPLTMLIPSKGVSIISKAVENIPEPEEIVELEVVKDDMHIRTGDWTCVVRLTSAVFPPYQQVIPKSSAHKATIARGAFIEAIKSVSLASSDATGGVTFKFTADKLRLNAESSEKGSGVDEVSCDFSSKEELGIGFNSGYILDALGAIDADEVTIGLGGELDPAVVRANEKTPAGTFVVMPVRLG